MSKYGLIKGLAVLGLVATIFSTALMLTFGGVSNASATSKIKTIMTDNDYDSANVNHKNEQAGAAYVAYQNGEISAEGYEKKLASTSDLSYDKFIQTSPNVSSEERQAYIEACEKLKYSQGLLWGAAGFGVLAVASEATRAIADAAETKELGKKKKLVTLER